MTSQTAATTAPINKTRVVPLEPEHAFELFTARMGEWWPLATHSIAGAGASGVRFEGRAGGQVLELTADGDEHAWAEVLAWEPPRRFVLSWHPSLEPTASTTLEVAFAPAEGGTAVTLTHRGWEAFGPRAAELRSSYDGGWDMVLARYEAAAGTGA